MLRTEGSSYDPVLLDLNSKPSGYSLKILMLHLRNVLPFGALALANIIGCGSEHVEVLPSERAPAVLTEAQMRADLRQYHDTIVNAWAYYDSKQRDHLVDVAGTRDKLFSQVSSATTSEEFAILLKKFAASLKDGHSDAILVSMPEPFPYSWPIGFLAVREGVMVANLNWLADNPDVELGDLLTKVDGEPVDEFLKSRIAITSTSSDDARRTIAVDRIHWCAQPNVRLQFSKQDGSSIERIFQCLPERVDYRNRVLTTFCTHSLVADKIIKITIPSFAWNNALFFAAKSDQEREEALVTAKNQIDEAFDATTGAEGLVLDLRDNDGGLELLSIYVAEHLFAGDFTYYELERRDSELLRSRAGHQGMDDNAFGIRLPQRPRQWHEFSHYDGRVFDGPVVVLINERCFSTTDNLCAFLHDVRRQNTRFAGWATNGGTGEPAIVDTLTNCGAQIQFCVSCVYSPSGRMIEGTGTLPDVPVERDRASTLQRRDPALEASLKLLRDW